MHRATLIDPDRQERHSSRQSHSATDLGMRRIAVWLKTWSGDLGATISVVSARNVGVIAPRFNKFSVGMAPICV